MTWIGEICLFASNKIPKDFKICDGSLVLISDYPLLFNLIGTAYGGDGVYNFNLPDHRGRIPMGAYGAALGQHLGSENIILSTQHIPPHTHRSIGNSEPGVFSMPNNKYFANTTEPSYKVNAVNLVQLNAGSIGTAAAGAGHNNIQPSIALVSAIAVFGIYPNFEV
jgi:microcystin-dependent protein